ncbi:unnamed protein product [Rotaria socialis]|uniref:FAD-binding domain-containing protein n=1 Tax=Rotaria socialis TaxID=392032 RepID=A0A821AHV5_9BILA|nr:unnamed protein product [Rotaria socialis]CAF4501644.1 unnamed protein product [Rotaria socialis]CAF4572505.1 unnamed protein product [Rotaria socialis]CAF4887902.1 unnamed protein product [Rotaria socialis]CAF4915929.1 unnamed protein product [Rotaria socialis]
MSSVSNSQQLVVLVSGGGPVGSTFALVLATMMRSHAKIYIYEGRWFVDQDDRTKWQGEGQGRIRRDQVVTLQDHVIHQMPTFIQKGLFSNLNERVWPTSRNIPIREVEDRLLALLEPFVESGQIELVPENLNERTDRLVNGYFHEKSTAVTSTIYKSLEAFRAHRAQCADDFGTKICGT